MVRRAQRQHPRSWAVNRFTDDSCSECAVTDLYIVYTITQDGLDVEPPTCSPCNLGFDPMDKFPTYHAPRASSQLCVGALMSSTIDGCAGSAVVACRHYAKCNYPRAGVTASARGHLGLVIYRMGCGLVLHQKACAVVRPPAWTVDGVADLTCARASRAGRIGLS